MAQCMLNAGTMRMYGVYFKIDNHQIVRSFEWFVNGMAEEAKN